MPAIRATVVDVMSHVRTALHDEASAAAGNTLLSRDEQATLAAGVLPATADEMRHSGGAGTRIEVDALVENATHTIATLLGQVNQPAGAGAALVSQEEVRQLAQVNRDAGARVARAYELITGRKIELPGDVVTPPPPSPARLSINAVTVEPAAARPTLALRPTIVDGASIHLTGNGPALAKLTIELPGRTITTEPMSRADKRAAIEAIRKAAPDLDVRVTKFEGRDAVIELWPKGAAPPPPTEPTYAHASINVIPPAGSGQSRMVLEPEPTGPTVSKTMDMRVGAGTAVNFRVDNRVFTAIARNDTDLSNLYFDLQGQLRAAGRDAEVRDYPSGFLYIRAL